MQHDRSISIFAADRVGHSPARATAFACVLLGTTSFYVEHALRLLRLTRAIEGPRHTLELTAPALLLEEAWGGRPQAGWVFGIPFRDRAPSDPVVRYPRPATAAALARLTERWPGRRCYYLWYDWHVGRYHLGGCTEIARHGNDAQPDTPVWYERGHWRDAFPYLPLGPAPRD